MTIKHGGGFTGRRAKAADISRPIKWQLKMKDKIIFEKLDNNFTSKYHVFGKSAVNVVLDDCNSASSTQTD